MKAIYDLLFFGILLSLTAVSCEREKTRDIPGFSIEFSEGTIIKESDILYYDSSTCIVYLKEALNVLVGTGDPDKIFTEFHVFIDEEEIYNGIMYPDMIFNMAPRSAIISSRTYPEFESDFIEIKHLRDIVNDQRIIDCLKKNDLLKKGISCTLDSLWVHSYCDSSLTCTFTLENHDDINYYIIDPLKMGVSDFICYSSGISLTNSANSDYYQPVISYFQPGCNELVLEDLSILKSSDKITFSYTATYQPGFTMGTYSAQLRYQSMGYFRPVMLPLNQEEGRIWIGQFYIIKDNIILD